MMSRLISNKELLLAALLTGFYLLTGFTPNPLAWPNQINNRIAITEAIQPDNPQIVLLEQEFEEFIKEEFNTKETNTSLSELYEVKAVELFLENKIPYITDFDNYFSWEYFPSISEVLKRGDDCDGISLVACSLLIRRGYETYIVLGKWHSWIEVHLDNLRRITIFNSELQKISPWYLKYNVNSVYIRETYLLDVILHNFLLILSLVKLTIIIFLFLKKYQAFQTVYATIFGIILSIIPTLFILMNISMP